MIDNRTRIEPCTVEFLGGKLYGHLEDTELGRNIGSPRIEDIEQGDRKKKVSSNSRKMETLFYSAFQSFCRDISRYNSILSKAMK